jgi:5-methylthioadenosine/S-adenosylhomocysteine deaminase
VDAAGLRPVEYLDRLGMVNEQLIAVHGVQFTDEELARLAAARRDGRHLPAQQPLDGAGTPPIERFYASGVRVAIGTDSLASVEDLNLFAEMADVRRLAPSVPRLAHSRQRDAGRAPRRWDCIRARVIEPGKARS